MKERIITREYLLDHPDEIFVFGDTTVRKGVAGGAGLRDLSNTYGFVTKRFPSRAFNSCFTPSEYGKIYTTEIEKLVKHMRANPSKTYLISKLGSGLANKYKIFENIIEPRIKEDLKDFKGVVWLW